MASDRRLLDAALAHVHSRAVLAIARADDEMGLEEGLRLTQLLEARSGQPVALESLLLAEPLETAELVAQLRGASSPFRNSGIHPSELAAMIVVDSISVVLAKGYVAEAEARELVRIASALGCSVDEVRAMCGHLAPFLAAHL